MGSRSEILIGGKYAEGATYSPALFDICLHVGYFPHINGRGIIFVFELGRKTLISYKKIKTREKFIK